MNFKHSSQDRVWSVLVSLGYVVGTSARASTGGAKSYT